jgi:hypothetical protein
MFLSLLFFSCLPNDLEGAVRQSGEAGAAFVNSGGNRAIVRASSIQICNLWWGKRMRFGISFKILTLKSCRWSF